MGDSVLDVSQSGKVSDAPFRAVYFDGLSSQKHAVSLTLSVSLEIVEDGHFLTAWAYGDVRRADSPVNVLRLRNVAAAPLARLEIRDSAARADIERACPLLDGEGSPGDGSRRKIVFWSLAATASVVAIIWFAIPVLAERLTPFIPVSLERRIGEATDKQIHLIFSGKNLHIARRGGGFGQTRRRVAG